MPGRRVPTEADLGTTARLNGTTSPGGITAGMDYSPEAIKTFGYGEYLRGLIGDPPVGMPNPHGHHGVFKIGIGEKQQTLVQEGQQILRDYDIDPIYGIENLSWAPNRVKDQHSIDALEPLVEDLRELRELGAPREEVLKVLQMHQDISASRR